MSTSLWIEILSFTNMTKPHLLPTWEKIIIDRNRTIFTLRNMPTAMTNCPSSMTFFIDQDSDFFACSEVFFHPFFKQLRKNLILFPEHIYQIDFFVLMIKKFVVHKGLLK